MQGNLSPVFKLLAIRCWKCTWTQKETWQNHEKISIKDLLDAMASLLTHGYFFKNLKTAVLLLLSPWAPATGTAWEKREHWSRSDVSLGQRNGWGIEEWLYVSPDWGTNELTANVETKCTASLFRRRAKLAAQLTPKPQSQQNSVAS